MNSAKFVLFIIFAVLIIPTVAAQDGFGGSITVGEVNEDATYTGGNIVVEGPVNGDLTVFAGNLVIEGDVNGNVSAFAGNTRISGTVDGDLEANTGNLQITEQGRIEDNLNANAGTVAIDGFVGGDAKVNAGSIEIGNFGSIDGDLEYSSEEFVNNGDVGGSITEIERQGRNVNFQALGSLYGFLSRLLIGALLLLILPKTSEKVIENSKQLFRSGFQGVLYLLISPVVIFILFITIIGIPLALIALVIYLLVLWVSSIYGSYIIGKRMLSERKYLALIVGLIVWEMLSFVPILGALIQLLIALVAVGALTSPIYVKIRSS